MVTLANYLKLLALELGVSSPKAALTTGATLLQLVSAAANVAQADGNTALVSALDALRLPVSGLTAPVRLGDLVEVSFPRGALADSRLNLLNRVTGFVQLYNYENVLTTPYPVTLSENSDRKQQHDVCYEPPRQSGRPSAGSAWR